MTTRLLLAASLLACVSHGAFAQDADPPSRVARLNWLDGNVSFQPASLDEWTAATLNYPLTTGDHIYTDTRSRAEMHVGPNAIRLDQESNFGFLNLDDQTVQMRFTEGSMELRLRQLDEQEIYEIDTPQAAISLLRIGDYRVDTDPGRNATMVTVWSGEVEVTANGRSFLIRPRQTAFITDNADPDIRDANPTDDFDNFAAARNQEEDSIPPPVYVSRSMDGYQDLDANGSWSNAPEYGWVWTPRVTADWAPYQFGHWAWVEPWGWTWIDDAAWGFAPFHYGRWAHYRGAWVWAPGAVVPRPVYAPALVAFIGGPSFGLSIGWFPLGPREPFYPRYHVSPVYVQRVNVSHVNNFNFTNFDANNYRYMNRNVNGAVAVVPRDAFTGARPVHPVAQRFNPGQIAVAQVVGTSPQVAPRRESVMGQQRIGHPVAAPSRAIETRPVVARRDAPPPAVSFAARQQMLDQNQGRPLAPDQMRELRRQQPGAVMDRAPVRVAGPAIRVTPGGRFPTDISPPNARPVQPAAPEAPQRPQFNRPAPESRPVPQPQSDNPRFNRPEFTRPAPEARPAQPAAPETPQRPQFNRPEFTRPAPEARPVQPAAPQAPQRPQFNRPAPENRPAPQAAPQRPPQEMGRPAAPAPHREARPSRDDNKAKEK